MTTSSPKSSGNSALRAFVFFVLSLLCFCGALAMRFLMSPVFLTGTVLAMSVIVLSAALWLLSTQSRGSVQACASIAFAWYVGGFFLIAAAEEEFSRDASARFDRPGQFSSLTGHCGIHSGRTVLKLVHLDGENEIAGLTSEYKMNEECRLHHFESLAARHAKLCEDHESPIACSVKWMGIFSERGQWGIQTRRYFYESVLNVFQDSKKEEQLVDYLTKDQELEVGRTGILKQMGLDESLSGRYLEVQEKEELENLNLTREIFSRLGSLITDTLTNPPVYLLKFKDLASDAKVRTDKIPELETELAKMNGISRRK